MAAVLASYLNCFGLPIQRAEDASIPHGDILFGLGDVGLVPVLQPPLATQAAPSKHDDVIIIIIIIVLINYKRRGRYAAGDDLPEEVAKAPSCTRLQSTHLQYSA